MVKKAANKAPEVDQEPKAEEPKLNHEKNSRKGIPYLKILLGLVLVYVVFAFGVGVSIYKYKNESSFTRFIVKVIPFPVGYSGGRFVSMDLYFKSLKEQEIYLTKYKKLDLKSERGKAELEQSRKTVIKKLLEDALIAQEAKKEKVTLTKKEIDEKYNDYITANGGPKAFDDILKNFYGVSRAEFKTLDFVPNLLRAKLTDKINQQENTTQASQKRAKEVLAKIKAGEDFAKLAKSYSEDVTTAGKGGDMGFFNKTKVVPEIAAAAFSMKVGQVSDLIRTVYGYHIIKITDKKGDQVRASNILIKVKDFSEWLSDDVKKQSGEKFLGLFPKYWEVYQKTGSIK
jgi:hypothetical protein